MKKILIVGGDSQPIPPINGGAVENLVQMFIETNEIKEKFEINVISCYDDKLEQEKNIYRHCNYEYINNYKKNSLFKRYYAIIVKKIFGREHVIKSDYAKQLVKKIKANYIDFDTILVENYIQAILPLKKKFPDKKIIYHLHNDKLNYGTIKGKEIVDACDSIITVSDYIKSRVDTIAEASNKTITILNSIYVDNFGTKDLHDNSHNIRKKLNIDKNDTVILFAGRVTKTKGVYELVSAFKDVVKDNLKLVIVGDSWYKKSPKKDKYIELVKNISENIKQNIVFTGYIDYSDMPNYYAIADIVVIPSIWQEPCSLTLFEAMASNKALLTTRTGGTPEVVKDYGILIEVNNDIIKSLSKKLEELVNNKEVRNELAKRGYDYVQKYNPDRYYNEIAKIINGVKEE